MAVQPAEPSPGAGNRPLSPHVQVWRWHITMLASILNRVTGVGTTIGLLGVVLWLLAIAGGPAKFDELAAFMRTPLGQAGLFALAAAAAFHFAGGVRHLIFDAGRGFRPSTADLTSWLAILFAVLAPVGLWLIAGAGAAP